MPPALTWVHGAFSGTARRWARATRFPCRSRRRRSRPSTRAVPGRRCRTRAARRPRAAPSCRSAGARRARARIGRGKRADPEHGVAGAQSEEQPPAHCLPCSPSGGATASYSASPEPRAIRAIVALGLGPGDAPLDRVLHRDGGAAAGERHHVLRLRVGLGLLAGRERLALEVGPLAHVAAHVVARVRAGLIRGERGEHRVALLLHRVDLHVGRRGDRRARRHRRGRGVAREQQGREAAQYLVDALGSVGRMS